MFRMYNIARNGGEFLIWFLQARRYSEADSSSPFRSSENAE